MPEIADQVLPAVVADHRARGIERLGQMVEGTHVVALRRICRQVGYTPAFVERHPGDDAGMAVVARQHLQPFARQPLHAPGEKT